MIVDVVHGGTDSFNAMIYQQPNNAVLNYINNNIEAARVMLGNVGSSFINTAKEMYNRYNGTEALNRTKMLMMNVGSHLNNDTIHYVSQAQIHNMNMIMQRYVMANPIISDLNSKNMCNGFQETYFDMEPDTYGTEREDYRRVMDGMLTFNKEGYSILNHYMSSNEEEPLHITEKISILDTWEMVERLIVGGIDPTDPELGAL